LLEALIIHHIAPIHLIQGIRQAPGLIDTLIQQPLHLLNPIINIPPELPDPFPTLPLTLPDLLVGSGRGDAGMVAAVDLVVEF